MNPLLTNSILAYELSLEEKATRESTSLNDSMKKISENGYGSASFDDDAISSLTKTFDDTYLPKNLWQFYKRIGAITLKCKSDKKVKFLDAKEIKDLYKETKEKNKSKDIFASDTMMPITEDVWIDLSGAIGTSGALYDVATNPDGTISSVNKRASNFEKWLSSVVYDIESKKEVSTEDCATCNGVVAGQKTPHDSGSGSFTYDETQEPGRKQVVQLSGPLSEIYTRALNIYYKKKPVFDTDDSLDDIDEIERKQIDEVSSLSDDELGVEGYQQIAPVHNYILRQVEENKLEDDRVGDITFVHSNIVQADPQEQVSMVVWMYPAIKAQAPEVIDLVKTSAEDKNKHVLMVITDEHKFNTAGMGIIHTWKDLVDNAQYVPGITKSEQMASFEAVYASEGIKVFPGFESFIDYLNSLK